MSKLNLTVVELTELWYSYKEIQNPSERFGQYVWNRAGVYGQSFPELFYERDPRVAWTIAYRDITN